MSNIIHRVLKSNTNIDVNFDGGELSSDSGLFLVKEFIHHMGIDHIIRRLFHTNDHASFRFHTDFANIMQALYQIIAGYFEDDRADNLTNEPVFTACLDKVALASQPTMSRFYNRMDETTLDQLLAIQKEIRSVVFSIPGERPNLMLFDLDTTLLNTYGDQEGSAWNYHYQSDGYHPKLCFNGLTGELLKADLRSGTEYCSNGIAEFMQPVFEEFTVDYPYTNMMLRGDSGFAAPELYDLCEEKNCQYAIRLKMNPVLVRKAESIAKILEEKTKEDMVSYACVYGEFQYRADTWKTERRVACKIEKPRNSMIYQYTFVVTTLQMTPEETVKFYCKRGNMENYIKEGKSGFDFSAVSSSSKIVNANRLQIHVLAYNIINWMKRFALPESMEKDTIDTIRLKLIKIASRVVRHAHRIIYKLCSSCPYKKEFFATLDKITHIRVCKHQLE